MLSGTLYQPDQPSGFARNKDFIKARGITVQVNSSPSQVKAKRYWLTSSTEISSLVAQSGKNLPAVQETEV